MKDDLCWRVSGLDFESELRRLNSRLYCQLDRQLEWQQLYEELDRQLYWQLNEQLEDKYDEK